MAETAAHPVDHILLALAVRQLVLSLPKRPRYYLKHGRDALNGMLRVVCDEIAKHRRAHSLGAWRDARASVAAFINVIQKTPLISLIKTGQKAIDYCDIAY
jgi:hypothetical protein